MHSTLSRTFEQDKRPAIAERFSPVFALLIIVPAHRYGW
jgi:hypothetical protein